MKKALYMTGIIGIIAYIITSIIAVRWSIKTMEVVFKPEEEKTEEK